MFFSSALPDLVFRHVTPSRWSAPLRLTTSVCLSRLMAPRLFPRARQARRLSPVLAAPPVAQAPHEYRARGLEKGRALSRLYSPSLEQRTILHLTKIGTSDFSRVYEFERRA